MAYVQQATDEDDIDKKNINLSDAAASGTGGATPTDGTGAPQAASNDPGGFVGIGDYLSNQSNANGAQALGQSIADKVNTTNQTAANAIKNAQTTFDTSSDAAKVNYDPSVVQNVINTGTTSDDWNKLTAGTYSGPKNWTDAGVDTGVTSALNDAQQTSGLTSTNGGRVELLREIANRPQSVGDVNLNAALVNGNDASAANIRNAASGYTALTPAQQAAEAEATARATANAANNTAVAGQATGAIGSYLDQQNAAIAAKLASDQAAQKAASDAATAVLKGYSSTGKATILPVDTSTAAGRASALSVTSPAPSPSTGKSTIQSVNTAATTPAPAPTTYTYQYDPAIYGTAQPWVGPPGTTGPLYNAPLPAGWQSLGITQQQAQDLANAVANASALGVAPGNFNGFYTASPTLTAANEINAADAARYNALATIAGRTNNYASAASTPYQFDYNGALSQAKGSYTAAEQAIIDNNAKYAAQQAAATPPPAPAPAPADSGGKKTTLPITTSPVAAIIAKDAGPRTADIVDPVGSSINKNGAVSTILNPALPIQTAVSGVVGKDISKLDPVGSAVTSVVKKITHGCVMATALVEAGEWQPERKNGLVEWCENTLHGNALGECIRRGYQVVCSQVMVPVIRRKGKLATYYQWTFENTTNLLSKKKFSWLSVPNTALWMTAVIVTGAFVSTEFARKCWTSLYKDVQ